MELILYWEKIGNKQYISKTGYMLGGDKYSGET